MNREIIVDEIDIPPPEDGDEPPGLQCSPFVQNLPSPSSVMFLPDLPIVPSNTIKTKPPVFPLARLPFAEGKLSKEFREIYFPDIPVLQWMNWKWQIKHRITDFASLCRYIHLTDEEEDFFRLQSTHFPLAITPYYLSLFALHAPTHPLRRSVVPTLSEVMATKDELADPLGEDHDSPVPGIVHRYPDRVLFLATTFCTTYCRYCTRSRIVSRPLSQTCLEERWEKGIDYIRKTPVIRDVLISGGDPLSLPDKLLQGLLSRLRAIPHVEIIRIGTKMPVVLPFRITYRLARMLKKFHPLYMNIHFTHPDELTPETADACIRLADAGIPLGSQTVLLREINDNPGTMTRLFQGLLRIRVKPYYLFQCDLAPGTSRFRTPVETGLAIIQKLRGHTSGLAVPHFVIDAPRGGGKIPLLPDYLDAKKDNTYVLKNYEGNLYTYPDVCAHGISRE